MRSTRSRARGGGLEAALAAFAPAGRVLELACGTGLWTAQLLRHADTVTAVDASAEMIAIASARVADERVRFIRADIFDWTPEDRYDVVFFGFWLSHVPLERFEYFWSLVGRCLAEDGRVFFVDDAYRTPAAQRRCRVPHPQGPAHARRARGSAERPRVARRRHARLGPVLLGGGPIARCEHLSRQPVVSNS